MDILIFLQCSAGFSLAAVSDLSSFSALLVGQQKGCLACQETRASYS